MTSSPEIIEMPQPLGFFAGELFDRAAEYLEAFRDLAERDRELMYAKYFLLAHAMELFFKSYLAANGISKADLKSPKKFGHDLEKLFNKCVELKMPTVVHLDLFAREIHDKNRDFDFRYPTAYNLHIPSPKLCLEVMEPLHDVLKPIISKRRLRAQMDWTNDTRHLQGKKIRWSD